jgi:hypothetical protein
MQSGEAITAILADFIQTVTTPERQPGFTTAIIGATLIATIGLSWYRIERTRKPKPLKERPPTEAERQ